MKRIPLDQRRAILQAKLRGASHQEAAEQVGVSKGTVVNVYNAAKAGQYEAFAGLEDQVNALAELSKRLDESDLDVSAAHAGLDVLEWLDELDLDPADIAALRDRLAGMAADQEALGAFGEAAMQLNQLASVTGYDIEDDLATLLDIVHDRGPEEIQALFSLTEVAADVSADSIRSAVETALALEERGFDISVADRIAAELSEEAESDPEDAVGTLISRYNHHESLRSAVGDAQAERNSLEETITALQGEREHHEAAIERLETSLASLEDSLEELRAVRTALQEDIETRREQRRALGNEVEELERELQSIQREREVVHAYRQFIRDERLSQLLLEDCLKLIQEDTGEFEENFAAPGRGTLDRTHEELLAVLEEMRQQEEYISVTEHEAELERARDIEGDLDALEEERDAILAFRTFLETGDIYESTLEQLLRIKQGTADHLDEERREAKVQNYLIEQLEELTAGQEAVSKQRYRQDMNELRNDYIADLQAAYATVERLSEHVEGLTEEITAEWIDSVTETFELKLETMEDPISKEDLTALIETVFADEIERRVEHQTEDRVVTEVSDRLTHLRAGSPALIRDV
jgi:CII-binding regulator of phage lambda lysogenization HflD